LRCPRVTGYSAYWIGQLAKRYNTDGPEGMHNRRHTTSHRNPPAVPPALQEELRQAVAEAAARHEHWTGRDAAAWIGARLGHPVTNHLGWRYLVRAKHSLQVPRPRRALGVVRATCRLTGGRLTRSGRMATKSGWITSSSRLLR
jgi:hypothetical protein